MTARELFDWMEGMDPSPYTEEQKLLWLNDLEAALWTEVFLQPAGLWRPRTGEELDRPLLLPEGRRMLCAAYLRAMTDFARGERGQYADSMALYNENLALLQCWYAENYAPAVTPAVWTGWASAAYDGTGEGRCLMVLPEGCAVLGAECVVTETGDLGALSLGTGAEPEAYLPAGEDPAGAGLRRSLRFQEPWDRQVYACGRGTGAARFRLLLQPAAGSLGRTARGGTVLSPGIPVSAGSGGAAAGITSITIEEI